MTKKLALTVARNLINDALDATTEDDLTEYVQELKDALGTIETMLTQIDKDTARNEQRKVENARERAYKMSKVGPSVREILSHTLQGMTAKDIFADFSANPSYHLTLPQLQYILLHDMKNEVEVIKNGRNANTYRLRDA